MTDTEKARAELARQRAEGTHTPAVECSCGTWHTPGVEHTKRDTGPMSKAGKLFSTKHKGIT